MILPTIGAGAERFTEAVNEKMDTLYLGKQKMQDNGTAEPTGPPTERFSADEDVPGLSLPGLDDVDGQAAGQKENTARGGAEDTMFERMNFTSEEKTAIQGVGRKSINQFSDENIKATEKVARRYWKEMGTKSPFFRAWFGDWRVNDQTPVQVADQPGDTRGTQRNADTGWNIQVSGKVFNESRHNAIGNQRAMAYLPYINDIVSKAVLLDSFGINATKSPNTLLMHSMYAVADIGNGPELLKLYVEELNDPNKDGTGKRAYQLQNIENQQPSVQGSGNSLSPITSTADIKTVSDLFAVVKAKDIKFNPKPASKVVNADGTPKVVYHGSAEQFTTFSYGHIGSSTGVGILGDGFYFTDKKRLAKGYGKNLYPVYLQMKNPYIATESDAYKLRTEDIQQQGYDGVILRAPQGDVYMVFENTQIKSATDNIGTFDGNNPDIRYSLDDAMDEDIQGLSLPTLEDLDDKTSYKEGRYTSQETDIDTEENSDYDDVEKEPIYISHRSGQDVVDVDHNLWAKRREEAKQVYGLDKTESDGVDNYIAGKAYEWNAILRGDPNYERTEFVDFWIQQAISGLSKFPRFAGRTYRNLSFANKVGINLFLAKHQTGMDVDVDYFASSSKDPNGYIVSGDYVVHMVIDGLDGRDISESYAIPGQQEVIYLPGTKLHITDVKTANDGQPLIYAQEVKENGKNLETNYGGNGQSASGTNDERQTGNAGRERNDLRRIHRNRGMEGNGNSGNEKIQRSGDSTRYGKVKERYSVDEAEQENKPQKKATKPVAESKPILAKRDV